MIRNSLKSELEFAVKYIESHQNPNQITEMMEHFTSLVQTVKARYYELENYINTHQNPDEITPTMQDAVSDYYILKAILF